MGLGPNGPSDRDIDAAFSAQWVAFVTAYLSPRARLLQWWRRLWRRAPLAQRLGHAAPQPPTARKRSDGTAEAAGQQEASGSAAASGVARATSMGPQPQECALAAMAYLLPLAGGLHLARPLLLACPVLATVCSPLLLLCAPLASPLGAALAHAWLCCSVVDRRTVQSYFVRYNFCQAILLGMVFMVLGLTGVVPVPAGGHSVRGLWPPWAGGSLLLLRGAGGGAVEPLSPPQLLLTAGALGFALVTWLWSSTCCLRGHFPDRIPLVSAMANRRVRW